MIIKFILRVVVLFALISVCAMHVTPEEIVKAQENHQAFLKFRSKEPQLRAFRARELLGYEMKPHDIATPPYGVLKRCVDDTGCCEAEGFTCTAISYDDVVLHFFIHDPVDRRNDRVVKYEGKSDKKCDCLKTKDGIK